jgi:hypothetical protein
LLAISRCFAGSIAAKPRFEPPLFVVAISGLLSEWLFANATAVAWFTMLMEVSKRLFGAGEFVRSK